MRSESDGDPRPGSSLTAESSATAHSTATHKHKSPMRRLMHGLKRLNSYSNDNSDSSSSDDDEQHQGSRDGRDGSEEFVERHRVQEIRFNYESIRARKKFFLTLAKCLLKFGAPSHRAGSQLNDIADTLLLNYTLLHLPGVMVISFRDVATGTSEVHIVRAAGRVALSILEKVYIIFHYVNEDEMLPSEATTQLEELLAAPPIYPLWIRCLLSFLSATLICSLAFGGSILDCVVGGAFACCLQFLGLKGASNSTIYANVYEVTGCVLVSFITRLLASLPGRLFCYNAVASAAITVILPGFTILTAALETSSKNITCGAVRLVYAVIYTFILGFGLTIGSEFYLLFNESAATNTDGLAVTRSIEYLTGLFIPLNVSMTGAEPDQRGFGVSLEIALPPDEAIHMVKGCFRDPSWPWWRQLLPAYTMLFLVPIYSFLSTMANLQSYRSRHTPVMVVFSCLAYTANKGASVISDRVYVSSSVGALVIGICGNVYGRFSRGGSYTSAVPGLMFLVPSALGLEGGLLSPYSSSTTAESAYLGSFSLGLRMIQVSVGITIGLFISQIAVFSIKREDKVVAVAA